MHNGVGIETGTVDCDGPALGVAMTIGRDAPDENRASLRSKRVGGHWNDLLTVNQHVVRAALGRAGEYEFAVLTAGNMAMVVGQAGWNRPLADIQLVLTHSRESVQKKEQAVARG